MNSLQEEHDVLLAEDDKDDAEIFEWALKEAEVPHVLRCAPDGRTLFIMLKEKRPYILFLDIMMPCNDGISCIMEIRKNREYDRLPVIMYTASTYSNFIETAYRNSANFYVVKSINPKNIVNHLKRIFSIDWGNYQHYPVLEDFVLA